MTSPAVTKAAFRCPHCAAIAHQFWYSAHADLLRKNNFPTVIADIASLQRNLDGIDDTEQRAKAKKWAANMATGLPFVDPSSVTRDYDIGNVWFSRCFSCDGVAIWLADKMIFPQSGEAPVASPDMPSDIRRDFDEAGKILAHSPRGAAALLRLAIQKLCKELGKPGRNINDDIGALVKDGLDRRVQQALDAVRVIGNSAVHPGQIDIRDDRETAEALFKLLNLIVERTISEPKHVQELYDSLPASALEAIRKRDEGAGTE